jgi:DNA-binding NarL/FixJ family response regulator
MARLAPEALPQPSWHMCASDWGDIRVAIVDDHVSIAGFMADSLRAHFDVTGVAQAPAEAITLVLATGPHVTLVDLQLKEGSGLGLIPALTKLGTHVIIFTMHDAATFQSLVKEAGAKGILAKSQLPAQFVEAIKHVASGGLWFPEPLRSAPGEVLLGRNRLEMIRQLRDGSSVKEIAKALSLSETTIEYHVRVLKKKLSANSLAGIVAEAIRRGYVPPPGLGS